jgi:plastocyanin
VPRAACHAAAVAAFVVAALPCSAGSVVGRVTVLGKGGRPTQDPGDTVVWVEGAKGTLKPSRAVITMRNKEFRPRVVAIPVGGTVEFPNADPILHNAFSVSRENRFDLDLYRSPQTGAWTFRHPGIVRVYCNIHPQMAAVVVVRDSPYFAQASADGSFAIEDVPAGRYALKAWHRTTVSPPAWASRPREGRVDLAWMPHLQAGTPTGTSMARTGGATGCTDGPDQKIRFSPAC